MARKAILAVDEGTTGTRAAWVTDEGDVGGLTYEKLSVSSPRPGVVEQSAAEILEKTIAVMRAAYADAQRNGLEVAAVAITTQRSTATLWNTDTGEPLAPSMVWQDTRYASDLQQLFVGSEGTLGVIANIKFKLHRLPDYSRAVAYGFASFADGLEACRQILQRGATPGALRLYDELESGLQFDEPKQNVLLIADEGEPKLIDAVIEISEEVCREIGGNELDGDVIFERWLDTRYLTGKSAEGFKKSPGLVADTLEMIGPWASLPAIYDEVVAAIESIDGSLAGSAHQSHAYVDSACLYFSLRGDVDPSTRADWYRKAWDAANEVIIKHGATLSHHHGVGLLRAPYMRESLGSGFQILEQIKATLDPKGILNPGKLGL